MGRNDAYGVYGMTPQSEIQFKTYFIKNMAEYGIFDLIECPDSCPGFPDIAYGIKSAFDGFPAIEGQIEMKWLDSKGNIKIRPAQIFWFRQRVSIGALPFLIWGFERGFGILEAVQIGRMERNLINREELMTITRIEDLYAWGDEDWLNIYRRLRHEES